MPANKSKAMRKAVVERLSCACAAYRKSLQECRNLGIAPESDDFSSAGHHSLSQATALAKLRDVRDEHQLAVNCYKEVIGRVPSKYKTSKSWQGYLLAPDE